MAGLEPMSFCLSDLKKAVVAKWQWSSVTQFSVSAGLVPTYKIYKICQFVGLKKKKSLLQSAFFFEKRRLKIDFLWNISKTSQCRKITKSTPLEHRKKLTAKNK